MTLKIPHYIQSEIIIPEISLNVHELKNEIQILSITKMYALCNVPVSYDCCSSEYW
jgi:hypothetical protein